MAVTVTPDVAASHRRPTPAVLVAALAFVVLFAHPFQLLLSDWWSDPDAGHGLLLGPVAVWLAWKARAPAAGDPARLAGLIVLAGSVALRYVSSLAAELFTMRLSMLGAAVGLVLFFGGWRRLKAWWLPGTLLLLSIPLPDVLVGAIALPLQFKASQMGAALLEMRNVPVRLEGNLILLPGHQLFVTEACSGLRSLTALLSLGVLSGGLWLNHPLSRVLLLAAALPVAVVLNGVRVFLTGFLVFFVDPAFGEGFMHMSEGWLLFVVAFLVLGAAAWAIAAVETRWRARRSNA